MVIEDERATRDSISFFLAAQGYNVVTAMHGKDALDEIERCEDIGGFISLIILDLRMPVMSGEEFLNRAKKLNLQIPVIVMSGCIEDFCLESDTILKPAAILTKPFKEQQLIETVRDILEN